MQLKKLVAVTTVVVSFNTASGRYCCNLKDAVNTYGINLKVSIPQAVGTVATYIPGVVKLDFSYVSIPQAVGTVATFANQYEQK